MNYFDMEELRNNKYIKEKKFSNGISSFNFSRKAFRKKIWNEQTIKARGLFLDSKTGEIIARSYEKFFDYDKKSELTFPISLSVKYNGFLGILSVYNNEFLFCSKSTMEGCHAALFKELFYKTLDIETQHKLFEYLRGNHCSAVFEVVTTKRDPHIIDYGDNEFVALLDIIKNETKFSIVDKEELSFIKKYMKEVPYYFNDEESFRVALGAIKAQDCIEGYVIQDAECRMYKLKTSYYDYWKATRSILIYGATKGCLFQHRFSSDMENFYMNEVLNYLEEFEEYPSVIEMRKRYKKYLSSKGKNNV